VGTQAGSGGVDLVQPGFIEFDDDGLGSLGADGTLAGHIYFHLSTRWPRRLPEPTLSAPSGRTRNPHRVGKPLDAPFDGYHSARRGTYRISYRINEDKHTIEIHSIRHRRDSYRT
jgi:mRNA-degrading endonuclease RelE of RelBE toxin-antitoxin system